MSATVMYFLLKGRPVGHAQNGEACQGLGSSRFDFRPLFDTAVPHGPVVVWATDVLVEGGPELPDRRELAGHLLRRPVLVLVDQGRVGLDDHCRPDPLDLRVRHFLNVLLGSRDQGRAGSNRWRSGTNEQPVTKQAEVERSW